MVSRNKGPTNPEVASLIYELRKASNTHEAPIWRAISKKLGKPRRLRPEVNISKINRYTEGTEFKTVLIPGKVLGAGEITHPVTVAAISVSQSAKEKIEKAKGKVITISDLVKENPKGKGVRILG
ncbi:MAG: 50S ribosomal protein L18e [Candidatus Heimdallarchaeota archaeon]|nr:50S ribosomal protein L18e [Candidatus Heimdallarchaeota archaeon]